MTLDHRRTRYKEASCPRTSMIQTIKQETAASLHISKHCRRINHRIPPMFATRAADLTQKEYGCRSGAILSARSQTPQTLDLPMAMDPSSHSSSSSSSSSSIHHTRPSRPTHIDLPPLHDLADWSFSPSGIAGPVFEDETFDNATLWSKHRYLCFSDAERTQKLFTSRVFDGEVACHTSLIKLRRDSQNEERWIQVERWSAEGKSWQVLN